MATAQRTQGRPPASSHARIEAAAFELFATRGFEATTLDDIAAAVGVGRRTLFRYFPSKNDIPWGQFDDSLVHLREHLRSMPRDIPLYEAVHRSVLDFNRLDEGAVAQHRQRMTLLLRTPALQAHSVLRYTQWRNVISEYVAERLSLSPTDFLPRIVGQVSLALALSAYEQWLEDEQSSLQALLEESLHGLRSYLQSR